jgi:peptide/nickel transport system permease protein
MRIIKDFWCESSWYIRLCSFFLILVALLFIISPFIAPYALTQDMTRTSLPAFSEGTLFGTDALGRDIFWLTLAGTNSALVGPILIASGSLVVGLLLGSLAGYFEGIPDFVITRYADIMLSMPSLLLAIAITGIVGGGYYAAVFVMLILYSPFDIKLVRSAVYEQKNLPYIDAARLLKLKSPVILTRQIFPNIAPLAFVNFFLNIAGGLVSMSSLSYLGLGVSPGAADWGRQLADGQDIIFVNPAAVLLPGIMIVLTALAINTLGNYLSERINTL